MNRLNKWILWQSIWYSVGVYSDVLSESSRYSFWHMYLAYLLTFFLALYLVYGRRFFVVEVPLGTRWSRARGSGLAGNSVIRRSRLSPAGYTLIRSLRLEVRLDHPDLELAVGGPAWITLILSLLFWCSGEHCDLALAVRELLVRVRRRPVGSSACSWGPAEEEQEEGEEEKVGQLT